MDNDGTSGLLANNPNRFATFDEGISLHFAISLLLPSAHWSCIRVDLRAESVPRMTFCNIVAQYVNYLTFTFEDNPFLFYVKTAFPTFKYPEFPPKEMAPFILRNGTVQLCDGQWHILPFPLLRCGHID